MDRKGQEAETESKWDWITCKYSMRREINGRGVFWNMSPSIVLSNPNSSVLIIFYILPH